MVYGATGPVSSFPTRTHKRTLALGAISRSIGAAAVACASLLGAARGEEKTCFSRMRSGFRTALADFRIRGLALADTIECVYECVNMQIECRVTSGVA